MYIYVCMYEYTCVYMCASMCVFAYYTNIFSICIMLMYLSACTYVYNKLYDVSYISKL